jgi:hypothetical protein
LGFSFLSTIEVVEIILNLFLVFWSGWKIKTVQNPKNANCFSRFLFIKLANFQKRLISKIKTFFRNCCACFGTKKISDINSKNDKTKAKEKIVSVEITELEKWREEMERLRESYETLTDKMHSHINKMQSKYGLGNDISVVEYYKAREGLKNKEELQDNLASWMEIDDRPTF